MAKGRKKKENIEADSSSLNDGASDLIVEESSVDKEESVKKAAKQKDQRNAGAMAPFAVVISFALLVAIVFSMFYRPGSSVLVTPDITTDLRVRLSITTQEFAAEGSSAGSLKVCESTKSFPGISQAKVIVNDSKDQPVAIIPVKQATSKAGTTCYFDLATKEYRKFTGSKLKVSVQFPFGTSNIFTVDVGNEPPYGRIDVNLTLS